MAEKKNLRLESQIRSKAQELVGCMCVVTFKQEGDRRGMIKRIESLTVGEDFPETFERSQFRVHLTAGEIVVVSGSAIDAIESTAADKNSTPSRRIPVKKAGRTKTKTKLAKKRKSISTKASKSAAKVKTRRAKHREVRKT
jgi:hypothetical protein